MCERLKRGSLLITLRSRGVKAVAAFKIELKQEIEWIIGELVFSQIV